MTGWEALPRHGLPANQVIADVAAREGDLPTHGGRLFAYVYDAGVPGLDDLQTAAYALSAHVNGLNPTVFPSLLAMENAIVGAVAGQLGGGPSGVATVVGNLTGGGTESLLLAVKAARDARPEITGPELVLPSTAHAAFAKAASYLAVRPVLVPVSRQTLRPDPEAVAAAITDRTVLVACSAPSYAHGVIDPVVAIAGAAAARGCAATSTDASAAGSCPTFGGSASRCRRSTSPCRGSPRSRWICTSTRTGRRAPRCCCTGTRRCGRRSTSPTRTGRATRWSTPPWRRPGLAVRSPPPTRPCGSSATTGTCGWPRRTWTPSACWRGRCPLWTVCGCCRSPVRSPLWCVSTATTCSSICSCSWSSCRSAVGTPSRSSRTADLPRSVHLTVTAAVAERARADGRSASSRAEEFGPVLRESVAAARAAGPVQVPGELAAVVANLTPAEFGPSLIDSMSAALGLGGSKPLPDRQAMINALLELAQVPVREAMLAGFLSSLQRPSY